MELKKIEDQLVKNGWKNPNADPWIKTNIFTDIVKYIGEDENVLSLAWTRKINQKGLLTPTYVMLVLTNIRIIVLTKNSLINDSKINEQWFSFDEVQYLNMESSNIHLHHVRINFIANGIGFALESMDSVSSAHFIEKTHLAIKKYNAKEKFKIAESKTIDLKNMKSIESDVPKSKVKKDKAKMKARIKNHKMTEHIFGHSSLTKSNPAMQIMIAFFALNWLILSSICVGIDYNGIYGLGQMGVSIVFGIILIFVTLLGLLMTIYYIGNIWVKGKIPINVIWALMLAIGFGFLFIASLLTASLIPGSKELLLIGIFASVLMISSTVIIFVKEYLEADKNDAKK